MLFDDFYESRMPCNIADFIGTDGNNYIKIKSLRIYAADFCFFRADIRGG